MELFLNVVDEVGVGALHAMGFAVVTFGLIYVMDPMVGRGMR